MSSRLRNTAAGGTPYVPALGFGWLTRFYEPLARRGLDDTRLKQQLVLQAGLAPGFCVLDVGSGTGTFALSMTESVPGLSVVGIDIDHKMVATSARRAQGAQGSIRITRGNASALPFAPLSFDRVLSCLVFHHLTHEERASAFEHIYRVLKVGGQFHFIDWTRPASLFAATLFHAVRLVDGFARTSDSAHGRLPDMLRHAGFRDVQVRRLHDTKLGTLGFFSAIKGSVSEPG